MTELAVLKRRVAQELEGYRTGRVRHPDLDDPSLFVELVLEWSPAEVDESAALLLYLVQHPVARDATLVQWATDLATGDSAWQSARADILLGNAPRPDPVRLQQATAVVQRLLAVASEQYAPAPAFMLAWLSWARASWPSP